MKKRLAETVYWCAFYGNKYLKKILLEMHECVPQQPSQKVLGFLENSDI